MNTEFGNRSPLRPLLTIIAAVVFTFLMIIAATIAALFGPRSKATHAVEKFWARTILRMAGVRARVRGLEHIRPDHVYIFISNHQGLFDIPLMMAYTPKQLRMIHKKELLWVPFFGFILWLLDFIAIDRGNRQRAAESLHRAAKKIHDGTNIVIYADGTRSIDGELRPFKKGAFILAIDAQVDVVPVTISGTINVIHKFEGVFDIRFGQTVELVFSPPISTDGMMPEAKDDLKDQVQNIIAAEYSKIKHLSAITNPAILSRLKK